MDPSLDYSDLPSDPLSERSHSLREIICNIRDAVVAITSFSSDRTKKGNGFFIKGFFIICPSSLVLSPPTENEYRFADQILVTVSNVNGQPSGESLTYQATVRGLDGAANLAILSIDYDQEWNQNNPHIHHCHQHVSWGKSRNTSAGDSIFIVGNVAPPTTIGFSSLIQEETAENGVLISNLSDNRYISYSGTVIGELLLLAVNLPARAVGLPVFSSNGKVIGMTLGGNLALAEYFMRRPVSKLLRSILDDDITERSQGFVTYTSECYVYNKGWLGLAGIPVVAEDHCTNIDAQGHRTRSTESNPDKRVLGYRILAIAQKTSIQDDFYLAGPDVQSSPLSGIVKVGDLVTTLSDCTLGDRKGQISPASIMWRVPPGTSIKLTYRKQDENFIREHQITVKTLPYPVYLDHPWAHFITEVTKFLPTVI